MLLSCVVVLLLIAASVVVGLIRDHVTPGIEGVLGIATAFFGSVAALKWGQGITESTSQANSTTQPPTQQP